jgi:hypothetical protein
MAISRIVSAKMPTTSSPRAIRISPNWVGETWPSRSKSLTPSSSSMCCRLRVSAGCETPSSAAALPKWRCLASALMSSNCRTEWMMRSRYRAMCQLVLDCYNQVCNL